MAAVQNVCQTTTGTHWASCVALNEHKKWSDMTTPEKLLKIVTIGFYSPHFSLAEKMDVSKLMSHFAPNPYYQPSDKDTSPFAHANLGDTNIACYHISDGKIKVECRSGDNITKSILNKEQSANLLHALPSGAYHTGLRPVSIRIPPQSLHSVGAINDYLKAVQNIPTAITGPVTDSSDSAFNSVWCDVVRTLPLECTRVVLDGVYIPPLVLSAYLKASGIDGRQDQTFMPKIPSLSEITTIYKQLSEDESDISREVALALLGLNENNALRAALFSSTYQSLCANEENLKVIANEILLTGTQDVIGEKLVNHRDIIITKNNDGTGPVNDRHSYTVHSSLYIFGVDCETQSHVKGLKWSADYYVPPYIEPTRNSMSVSAPS
jgi:hypothetical protein